MSKRLLGFRPLSAVAAGDRPPKMDDYFVHRIADLFRYADGLQFSQFKEPVIITDKRLIPCGIGERLCDLKPEDRPRILHQVAYALAGKSAKKRKSGKADDIAKIREAWPRAKAKLKGLYRGDNPTFREVYAEYHKLTGFPLDRRALKNAGCPVRPESRRKKLPR
jgi:hypothetical protein